MSDEPWEETAYQEPVYRDGTENDACDFGCAKFCVNPAARANGECASACRAYGRRISEERGHQL